MKRMSLLWSLVIIIIGSFNLLSCGSSGGGGSSRLDNTFGNQGKVTTPIGIIDDQITSVKVQSDGKLVAAGYSKNNTTGDYEFALVRYNTDGSLDAAGFGTGGIVTTAIGSVDDKAFALVIQSDGKLVAAGYSNNGSQPAFALVRYNTDGSLDASFGTGGVVTTTIGLFDKVFALAIQSDGKLVAAGYSYNGGANANEFALVRYSDVDGSPDASFGTGGIVTTAVGDDDAANSLVIQQDGKLVAGGYSFNNGTGVYEFALVRYSDVDGSPDASFGTGGVVTTAVGDDDAVNSLVIQSDGKLVAGGYSLNNGTGVYEFALVRYSDVDGSPDASFGTGGIVTTGIGTVDDRAYALAIQSDGKLVAAGYTDDGDITNGPWKFALVRYNTDGSPDTSFGPGGAVTTAIGTLEDIAYALAIQSDGKLIAAGYSDDGIQFQFALARYSP